MTDHPLTQLTLVRFREFLREPEALFWTFIFPILIAAGLSIAFENRPVEVLAIGVVGPDLTAVFEEEPRWPSRRSQTPRSGSGRSARARWRC